MSNLFRDIAHVPASRNSDPHSSFEAEADHARSGNRQANADIALALVRRHPGSTYRELFAWATGDEQEQLGDNGAVELQRRLNDLSQLEPPKVKRGTHRRCRVGGRRMQTWDLA